MIQRFALLLIAFLLFKNEIEWIENENSRKNIFFFFFKNKNDLQVWEWIQQAFGVGP